MRAFAAGILIGILSACGAVASPQSPTATTTQSPAATTLVTPTAESPSPVRPNPTPSKLPLLPLTTLDFSCRLPVAPYASGPAFFVDFPSRTVTLAGSGVFYYDPVVKRWLPVFASAVSPDGREYAFTEAPKLPPARVHIADAATGTDLKVFTINDGNDYRVHSFTAQGVNLVQGFEGRWPGIWRLDPGTGAVVKVTDGFFLPEAEWFGAVDPRDPSPVVSPFDGSVGENRIDHRDADGHLTSWFYLPNHALDWLQFKGSQRLLVAARWTSADALDHGLEYWLVAGPNQATELWSWKYSEIPSPYTDTSQGVVGAFADAHGIWLGGGSIYLVTSSGSLSRVYGEGDVSGWAGGTCD